jgi:hypothetical protein
MLLAEFVAEKLKQIIQGARAAQENATEAEKSLNPQTAAPKGEGATSSGEWHKRYEGLSLPVEMIHFGVAAISTGKEKAAGGVEFLISVRLRPRGELRHRASN